MADKLARMHDARHVETFRCEQGIHEGNRIDVYEVGPRASEGLLETTNCLVVERPRLAPPLVWKDCDVAVVLRDSLQVRVASARKRKTGRMLCGRRRHHSLSIPVVEQGAAGFELRGSWSFRGDLPTRAPDLVGVNTITLMDPLLAAKRLHVPSIHARELVSHDEELAAPSARTHQASCHGFEERRISSSPIPTRRMYFTARKAETTCSLRASRAEATRTCKLSRSTPATSHALFHTSRGARRGRSTTRQLVVSRRPSDARGPTWSTSIRLPSWIPCSQRNVSTCRSSCMHVSSSVTTRTWPRCSATTRPTIVRSIRAASDFIIANSDTTHRFYRTGAEVPALQLLALDRFDLPNVPEPGTLKVGIVSSNHPKKGIEQFVNLAIMAARPRPDLEFLVFGPRNEYADRLEQRVRNEDIPARVRFPGYVEDPAEAMRQVNVVVSFSLVAEAYGRTIAEALAARRPVIAYRWGAAPELVRPRDGTAFSFRILISRKRWSISGCWPTVQDRLQEMGGNGRERAERLFSPDTFASHAERNLSPHVIEAWENAQGSHLRT